jgi:hypothetical protein
VMVSSSADHESRYQAQGTEVTGVGLKLDRA